MDKRENTFNYAIGCRAIIDELIYHKTKALKERTK
jgi:hypothetical protein